MDWKNLISLLTPKRVLGKNKKKEKEAKIFFQIKQILSINFIKAVIKTLA